MLNGPDLEPFNTAPHLEAPVEIFSRIVSVDNYFDLATAWGHSRNYVYAVQTYNQLLELEPAHAGALKNRDEIQQIIDEINPPQRQPTSRNQ